MAAVIKNSAHDLGTDGTNTSDRGQVCVYCHTQQIRDLESDKQRYGWRLVDAAVSESWEYTNDKYHFLGTKRTGPDLARVGGKYSNEWHWAHFKDPRNMARKVRGDMLIWCQ